MARCQLVVPCYNEARRLSVAAFESFLGKHDGVELLLVNDGSTDDTLTLLRDLERRLPDRVDVLDGQPNAGKAFAVQRGMAVALESGAELVGYWDADLATPLEAVSEFVEQLERNPDLQMVFGARVQLLGRSIRRQPLRHYLGRVFATAVSSALHLAIYDTQCGAKVFRATDLVRTLFRDPFVTDWIFDVEILARLVALHRAGQAPAPETLIYELPLRAWQDVAGSKVTPMDFPRALAELLRIYIRYLR